MRETCARVLAAALMTGAIATAMGLPTLFDGAGDLGPGVTAPPSSLQRSVRVPALSAPRPARAERLVTAQTAGPPVEQPAIVRVERSGGAVQVPRPNPPPGGGRPGSPAPAAPAPPAPAPPAPAPPAPAPETRELTSTTPEQTAATPTASTTTAGGAGGKKGPQTTSGNSTAAGKHQGKKDAAQANGPVPPAAAAPPADAAAPAEAAPPATAAEPQDEPETKEHGHGKGRDKDHRDKAED
jgi:hypothetical protein